MLEVLAFFVKKGKCLKISLNQDKYFDLLDFTALTYEPIVCAETFSGARQNPLVELGPDFVKELIGNAEDPCFVENNFGGDKALPRDPACVFKGSKIVAFYEIVR